MPLGAVVRQTFEGHINSHFNRFLIDANDKLFFADDVICTIGDHSANIALQIGIKRGDSSLVAHAGSVRDFFQGGRALISFVRFPAALNKLITGQTFWQTSKEGKGWRKVVYVEGKPYRIPKGELAAEWTKNDADKFWYNNTTLEKSTDGKYIEDYVHGECLTRDWICIAQDILILFARLISPIYRLHHLGVYDLRHHSKGLSGATAGIWGAVLSLAIIEETINVIEEEDVEKLDYRVLALVQSILDLLALLPDFGVCTGHPSAAIAGSVLNLLKALLLGAREMFNLKA